MQSRRFGWNVAALAVDYTLTHISLAWLLQDGTAPMLNTRQYTYIIYQKSNLIISGVQHVSLSANLDCNVADLLLRFLAPATDDFDQAKSNERSGNASCCDML